MKLTKELLAESLRAADARTSGWQSYSTLLDAAYRSALARAELAERHYSEVIQWMKSLEPITEHWAELEARHLRERKELEA